MQTSGLCLHICHCHHHLALSLLLGCDLSVPLVTSQSLQQRCPHTTGLWRPAGDAMLWVRLAPHWEPGVFPWGEVLGMRNKGHCC